MIEEVFLFEEDPTVVLVLAYGEFIPEIIRVGGRKAPMAFAQHRTIRMRSEEEEEQLRLLKLLNEANTAKKLKRWQEEENEAARQHHQELLLGRLRGTYEKKQISGVPNVKKANREIAKRDEEAERKRQEQIRQVRLSNLEKARKARS